LNSTVVAINGHVFKERAMNIKNTRLYLFIRRMYWRYFVKFVRKFYPEYHKKGTGNSDSPVYCYARFMKHLMYLHKAGIGGGVSLAAAEFGPGESLGIGLCAMLAGANKYYALDVVEHTDKSKNIAMLEELVKFFKSKAAIPDTREDFPANILTDDILRESLKAERIDKIKFLLSQKGEDTCFYGDTKLVVKYIVPWENYTGSYPLVDWVFSEAVLEHIDNLNNFYEVMNKILKHNGFASHAIDFRSHDETWTWNGHWGISEKKWGKIRDWRPYLINREPLSTHLRLFDANGFKVLLTDKLSGAGEDRPAIQRNHLAEKFRNMTDEDFNTSRCFVVAEKS